MADIKAGLIAFLNVPKKIKLFLKGLTRKQKCAVVSYSMVLFVVLCLNSVDSIHNWYDQLAIGRRLLAASIAVSLGFAIYFALDWFSDKIANKWVELNSDDQDVFL